MNRPLRLATAAVTAAAVAAVVSLPVRLGPPDGGPGPAAEAASGTVAGIPIATAGGYPVAVASPADVTIAVSPWVAWRFGRQVLRDAEQTFSPGGSRLQVRYVVRMWPSRSDLSVTTSGMQVLHCGRVHGFARYTTGPPDGTIAPVVGGRIRICGDTYRWQHDRQVALLVHETAHLLGLGHTCEGDRCRPQRRTGDRDGELSDPQPAGCRHLMAGAYIDGCPIDLSSLEPAWMLLYPRR